MSNFSGYTGSVSASIPTPVPSSNTLFQTTETLAADATYDSGIFSLVGYSQVQTEVLSDTDGTLQFIFHAEIGGGGNNVTASLTWLED